MRLCIWLIVLQNLISGVSPITDGTRSFVIESFASGDVERSSRNGGKLRASPFSTPNRSSSLLSSEEDLFIQTPCFFFYAFVKENKAENNTSDRFSYLSSSKERQTRESVRDIRSTRL